MESEREAHAVSNTVPYTSISVRKTHMRRKSYLFINTFHVWITLWLYSREDTKQCLQKFMLLSTLEYNEHASASMGTEGKDYEYTDLPVPNSSVSLKETTYNQLYICMPSTVLGPVSDHDYPLDIFISPWQISSSAEQERETQNAKVAPECWCGTSEFCVEIISLLSCHLGSGCWRVA